MSESAAAPAAPTDAGLVARLAAQRQKFKAAWSGLQTKVTSLEKLVGDLTAERDALAAKTDTSAAAKRVDELTAELRGYKHRQAFDAAALKSGARPEALEDLWKLSEVKPESDEPDAAKLQAVIDGQKAARAWAFAAEQPPADPNAPPPPKPAAGSGKGGSVGAPAMFSDEQLNDPKFVMANFERISAAASERVAKGQV